MKLQNTTDFPDALIREVWQFVKPQGVACDVHVRNTSWGRSGHSYQDHVVASIHTQRVPTKEPRIRRILKAQGLKARNRADGKGYLDFAVLSPLEALVEVLAHEARHQHQGKRRVSITKGHTYIRYGFPGETVTTRTGTVHYNARRMRGVMVTQKRLRGMVWGSRGRFSERDADAYALRQLRAWRRAHRSEPTMNPDLWEIDWRFKRFNIEILTDRGYETRELTKDMLTGAIKVAA